MQIDKGLQLIYESIQKDQYGRPTCPLCHELAVGSCRCSGPHSLDDLKNGHGLHCKNGHYYSGDLVYDSNKK